MPSDVRFYGYNAENSIYAGALSQTPLGELTALPRPLAVFRGPTSKGKEGDRGGRGREGKRESEGEMRGREGREGKGKSP